MFMTNDIFYYIGQFVFGLGIYLSISNNTDKILWNICKIESKTKKIYKKFLLPYYIQYFPESEKSDVHVYKNGEQIYELSYIDSIKLTTPENYDLVTYTIKNDRDENYVAFYNDISLLTNNLQLSNVRFINVTIKINNNIFDITHPNNSYPYVIGNILFDKSYIKWCGIKINDDDEYSLEIIDNNVNLLELKCNKEYYETIKLEKDTYVVEKKIINNKRKMSMEIIDNDTILEKVEDKENGLFSWLFNQNKIKCD